MSADHAAGRERILREIASKLPVRRNSRALQIWVACMVIGVATFVWLLFNQPQRAWGSYAINTIYWLGIAQGAVVLACAIRLCNGRWGGPIVRINPEDRRKPREAAIGLPVEVPPGVNLDEETGKLLKDTRQHVESAKLNLELLQA